MVIVTTSRKAGTLVTFYVIFLVDRELVIRLGSYGGRIREHYLMLNVALSTTTGMVKKERRSTVTIVSTNCFYGGSD